MLLREETVLMKWSQLSSILDDLLKDYPLSQISFYYQTQECEVTKRRPIPLSSLPTVSSRSTLSYQQDSLRRDVYYKILTVPETSPYAEMEIAIPRPLLGQAIRDILNLLETNANSDWLSPRLFIRFSAQDKLSYLGMNADRPKTAYISFFGDVQNSTNYHLLSILSDYQRLMVTKYRGRPHYGKKNFLDQEQMSILYPHYDQFCMVKDLMDPNGMFNNSYIKRLF